MTEQAVNARAALAQIINDHDWIYDTDLDYEVCRCGVDPRTMAGHIADLIIEAGWTPPIRTSGSGDGSGRRSGVAVNQQETANPL